MGEHGFDAAALLGWIGGATAEVLETAGRFGEDEVRGASLLPGWSRGHVLTHLARNADGGRRLLVWARTGVETHEYASLEARAAEIEAGAGRGAAELLADLRESAERFAAEYRRMPAEAWHRTVRWTRGQQHPAARAADARLSEVLIHHVDLAAGYTSARWPAPFVRTMLARVVASLSTREQTPAVRLRATDTGAAHTLGTAPAATVEGPAHALLAWLLGRSPGTALTLTGTPHLPTMPAVY
jgi:maleylpyruvate isomerase